MIRLMGLRLVNWYHFVDETFRFDGSCLILGDNGSGKSTVLDAVQWALVADQQQVRFNKAANEQSRRSLYGYVRYKLGSEDEARPGQVRFGRGACSSYVTLQFADDADSRGDFVCGIAMEAGETDTHVARVHFVVPGATLDDIPALAPGDLVRPLRDFRQALRALPQAKPFADAGTYREELRHRLGAVPEAFHRLIVKALDFRPIGQVRDFVFHYLLDERPIDTVALQANLEHYKRLEAQARDAERRLAALDAICTQGERIVQERRTAQSHRYLTLRAAVELAETSVREVERQLEETARTQQRLEADAARAEAQAQFFRGERDRLTALLVATPGFRDIQALERDLDGARRDVADATEAEARTRRLLGAQRALLDTLLSQEARNVRAAHPTVFSERSLLGAADEPAVVSRLGETLAGDGALAGRDLAAWSGWLARTSDALAVGLSRLGDALEAAKDEGRALEAEQEQLDRGRHRYPEGSEALLHLLAARLRGAREPRPLCELIEVTAPRWRDAIEGYLNTRRFDVIVAPGDFPRALSLYEQHKRDFNLPGRGRVFIAGAGLVDIERVQAAAPRREPRSLAEQVVTDDLLARAYVDFLIGDVICCENERELRRHRRAITDTVMVYQNHVARQTHPDVFRRHYIGDAARVRRREEIARRLTELSQLVVDTARTIEWLQAIAVGCRRAALEAAELPAVIETAQRLGDLKARAAALQRQLDRIDRKELDQLERERQATDGELGRLGGEERDLRERIGACKKDLEHLADDRIRAATAETDAAAALEAASRESGDDAERNAAHEERYARERAVREPAEIRDVFDRQYRNIDSRVQTLLLGFVKLKTEYANAFGLAADLEAEGYAEFEAQRELWRDSRLPEYRERIVRAKEEAIQQLAEDVIFRLRENLVDVRRQVDELNRALKDVPFGSERYQFTLEVATEHRAFYDLIMDAGRFEKDSLFGADALARDDTRRTLTDLFDRLVQAEAREVKTELEARADYREYFDYDLRIQHADGTYSLYGRVAADKSGGETQNPYYIAIFASLYRLYRSLAPDGRPRCGLVLLDEAFSKMDEARIESTLRFARSLGLQLVLATPKERSELVAPWVETSLYIHRDPMSGAPTVLDFTKEFKRDEAG
ncbi:MAG: hypothetical protein E6K74_12345 [Candidatus Eisenbacteria bacterium]|uniref:Uncharacterized protein n=1 Tax=Eiseniibacteriota bacterium TaxID=2212470 RepID=A0A538SLZ3_UNCEI|nr:MAG: hypothetical protein E6K74_12345 [Candidatus Eisenbacteria bacterium]